MHLYLTTSVPSFNDRIIYFHLEELWSDSCCGSSSSMALIPFYHFLRALHCVLISPKLCWGYQLPSVAGWIDRDMGWSARSPTKRPSLIVQRWVGPGHSMPQFLPFKAGVLPHHPSSCLLQAEDKTPCGPLTSSHTTSLQYFILWGLLRGLSFILRSWKSFHTKSQNHLCWKRPLRLSSPTFD